MVEREKKKNCLKMYNFKNNLPHLVRYICQKLLGQESFQLHSVCEDSCHPVLFLHHGDVPYQQLLLQLLPQTSLPRAAINLIDSFSISSSSLGRFSSKIVFTRLWLPKLKKRNFILCSPWVTSTSTLYSMRCSEHSEANVLPATPAWRGSRWGCRWCCSSSCGSSLPG